MKLSFVHTRPISGQCVGYRTPHRYGKASVTSAPFNTDLFYMSQVVGSKVTTTITATGNERHVSFTSGAGYLATLRS